MPIGRGKIKDLAMERQARIKTVGVRVERG